MESRNVAPDHKQFKIGEKIESMKLNLSDRKLDQMFYNFQKKIISVWHFSATH